MLRERPNACTGCKANPYENPERKREHEQLAQYGPLIEEAFRLHDLMEMGFLEEPSVIHIEIVRVVHHDILFQRMKLQAVLIAHHVSQMFGDK